MTGRSITMRYIGMNMEMFRDIATTACMVIIVFLMMMVYVFKPRNTAVSFELKEYEAKNAALHRECDSLKMIVIWLQQENKGQYVILDSLYAILDKNSTEINQKRMEYEKEINRINDIPADSLYGIYTEYVEGWRKR